MLSIFLTKIIAAIFYFNGAGERKKSVPKEWLSVRNRESGRGGELKIIALSPPPTSPSTLTQNQT